MKKIILLFFLTSTFLTFSQKKKIEFKQPYPLFEECKTSVTPSECFNNVVISKILPSIENEIKEYLKNNSEKESVCIYISFIIGDNGRSEKESIKTSNIKANPIIKEKLISTVINLPKISPIKNEFNHPILSDYRISLVLGLNEVNEVTVIESTNDQSEIPEDSEHTAPIYPKCKGPTNIEFKRCFSYMVSKLISKKYNPANVTSNFNKKGTFRTYVFFKIDKNGEVNKLNAFGPNENFKKEALKSLKKIKTLKPGTHNGKPVNVTYAVPISLYFE